VKGPFPAFYAGSGCRLAHASRPPFNASVYKFIIYFVREFTKKINRSNIILNQLHFARLLPEAEHCFVEEIT